MNEEQNEVKSEPKTYLHNEPTLIPFLAISRHYVICAYLAVAISRLLQVAIGHVCLLLVVFYADIISIRW